MFVAADWAFGSLFFLACEEEEYGPGGLPGVSSMLFEPLDVQPVPLEPFLELPLELPFPVPEPELG